MRIHQLPAGEWGKVVAIGVVVAVLTGAIMFAGLQAGVSPLPRPLALAFAQTLLGPVPMPVGMLFHVAWVTLMSVVYVVLFRDALTFMRALGLAVVLWLLVLVFFFPFVGWGFFGLSESPRLIVAAAISHLLFAIFLWGLSRLAFSSRTVTG
ncbi:hypothetical protein [Chelativorans salis]|uniref:Transmembrane protein n=1 Tax=Chelativorans salis TaxID=2978478 RepID=A0ABT2LGG1_9HYPH|nr:hypothetical protein [Chelativorans sp. EGI FJ00035]MCT7373585.1 hypothetical protein [Chelativorans sp. EGI FJ00035]